MCHVEIPDVLIEQIKPAGLPGVAVEEFVRQAVRDKLSAEERRKEFHRLASETHQMMVEKGLTEVEVLADFENQRRPKISQSVDDFDALCDEATVAAPDTHLTRDQLQERD
jgi:hypothetical protein